MLKHVLTLLAASITMTSPAIAGTDEGRFAVEGAGQLDCATFMKARADRSSATYQRLIGFVEGYMSAANRYEPNTFDLTPWHNAAAFDLILNSHCAEHSEDSLISVVQRMVTGLRPVRIAQFSPLVEVSDDQNRTYVYETILRRAQAALKIHGHYEGEEDGRFSPEFRAALQSFQRSASLDTTGFPDPATLWTLLNP